MMRLKDVNVAQPVALLEDKVAEKASRRLILSAAWNRVHSENGWMW